MRNFIFLILIFHVINVFANDSSKYTGSFCPVAIAKNLRRCFSTSKVKGGYFLFINDRTTNHFLFIEGKETFEWIFESQVSEALPSF